MTKEPIEPFGPCYNVDGAGLKAFRRAARTGLNKLSRDERQAYGAAVEKAVLAKQRVEARTACETIPRPNCASGTYHSDGRAISKAVREQQARALLACPAAIRRARKPNVWLEMYEEAMEHKRQLQAA